MFFNAKKNLRHPEERHGKAVTRLEGRRALMQPIAAAAVLTGSLLAGCSALAQSPGNFSTLSATGTATLNGDVLMCSGRPWIDVKCNGAIGDGSHDDTGAIQATINSAVTNNCGIM